MPSPFLGMDPYLEEPTTWGGFHSRLINSISDRLADLVSPNFFVDIEERVYIFSADDPERRRVIVPDVYVAVRPQAVTPSTARVEEITPPKLVEPLDDYEVRDRFIQIYDARNREVVTTLEVLSPLNKAAGTQGRRDFLQKRETVMASGVHWVEIDLLRAGDRSPEAVENSDYYALLKRGRERPFALWYFNLRDRLPTIAVPLRPPFADVPLNLQVLLETVYARGHYAESIDYSKLPPLPRLRPADEAWAQERLREWGAAQQRHA